MQGSSDEFSLIETIRRRASVGPLTRLGIGDDTAQLLTRGHAGVLVAVDVLMDGVHFDLSQISPQTAGRKALAVNLSDIAAMAGQPTAAVVGLVLPRNRGALLGKQLMEGLIAHADEFGVDVIGGDTNSWDGPLVISVTVLGEPTARRSVTRAGALPGDWLFVTGALGGSLSGRHLTFTPRVAEALSLHERVDLHSMIDLSDGLASDVRHIAKASNVGVEIDADNIPIHTDVNPSLSKHERILHALTDGEDFELLFSVSEADGHRLLEEPELACQLTLIGRVTAGDCLLVHSDGTKAQLPQGGWRHRFDD